MRKPLWFLGGVFGVWMLTVLGLRSRRGPRWRLGPGRGVGGLRRGVGGHQLGVEHALDGHPTHGTRPLLPEPRPQAAMGGKQTESIIPPVPITPKSDPKTACFAPNLVWKTWQQGRAVTSGPISSRQMTQALSSAGSASGVAPGRLCGMELWGKIPHHVRPMGVMRGRPKGSPSSLSSLISLFNYIVSQVWGHPEPSSLPIRSSQPIFGGQKWPISPRFGSALLKADPTPPKETNAATGTFPPPHSPSLPELIEAFNYISRRP